MDPGISQLSSTVLTIIVNTSAMIWIERHRAKIASRPQSGHSHSGPDAPNPEIATMGAQSTEIPNDSLRAKRADRWIPITFFVWGQALMFAAGFLPAAPSLSVATMSFIVGGAVFMAVGLLLLFRD